jgi:hypothetical protein
MGYPRCAAKIGAWTPRLCVVGFQSESGRGGRGVGPSAPGRGNRLHVADRAPKEEACACSSRSFVRTAAPTRSDAGAAWPRAGRAAARPQPGARPVSRSRSRPDPTAPGIQASPDILTRSLTSPMRVLPSASARCTESRLSRLSASGPRRYALRPPRSGCRAHRARRPRPERNRRRRCRGVRSSCRRDA